MTKTRLKQIIEELEKINKTRVNETPEWVDELRELIDASKDYDGPLGKAKMKHLPLNMYSRLQAEGYLANILGGERFMRGYVRDYIENGTLLVLLKKLSK